MGYTLAEMSGTALASIFESAQMECRIDEQGSLSVKRKVWAMVNALPDNGVLRIAINVPVSGTRDQVYEFCNRFNTKLAMVRAGVPWLNTRPDDPASKWLLSLSYDLIADDDDEIESESILMLLAMFEDIVLYGIEELDADGIVS